MREQIIPQSATWTGMSSYLAWIRQWRVSVEQLSSPLDSYLSPSQLVTAVLI